MQPLRARLRGAETQRRLEVAELEKEMENERRRSDRLLKNVFPPHVAAKLKARSEKCARLFCDSYKCSRRIWISPRRFSSLLWLRSLSTSAFSLPTLSGSSFAAVHGIARALNGSKRDGRFLCRFTDLTAHISPMQLIEFLNSVF